ncbi:MAG TPA: DUF5317 family protein [Actinomycetota bacterium]|nr:DUF5317 family protein [Actinomycetota bacterium]
MFKLMALTIAAAVAAGFLARGRLRRLADVQFRGLPILFVSLGVALLPLLVEVSDSAARWLTGIANLVVIAFLAVNVRAMRGLIRVGLVVVAAGWMLNAIVIAANAGMPLSVRAYERSGQTDPITAGQGGFYKIVVADDDTTLRFLGDAIPVRALGQVVSVGDILLSVGIGVAVTGGMRGDATRAPREPIRQAAP